MDLPATKLVLTTVCLLGIDRNVLQLFPASLYTSAFNALQK